MARTLSIGLLLLFFLVMGGVLLWYLAYGLDRQPPRRASIPGLSAAVEIGWHDQDVVAIEAQNEPDAFAALGYAHGRTRAWSAALWRQTALGRLGEWFGDGVLDLDAFTRRLGFAALARQAYSQLPEEDQLLLQAYTRGMNAALESRSVRLQGEFTLLDVLPEPWAPWHTLALERLFAWLATAPLTPDTAAVAGEDAAAFFHADALLREWLHLHGFEHGNAWIVQDTAGAFFFQRHVYGAAAVPLFQDVVATWPEQGALLGASLPGTPFFPAGKTATQAWAVLLSSTARLERVVPDTAAGTLTYERILSRAGKEHLLKVRRTGTMIQFEPPPRSGPSALPDSLLPPAVPASTRPRLNAAADTLPLPRPALTDTLPSAPDSTWAVRWTGLSPTTDWQAWRDLRTGTPAAFHLVEGDGLLLEADGTWQVMGTPETTVRFPQGILVGNAPSSRYPAARLDSLLQQADADSDVETWSTDAYSPWAADLAPLMIASVDSVPNRAESVEEALTYLRNWNHTYDRTSIGASIFDTWVVQYRESMGHLPRREVPDTIYFENIRRYQALQRAVARLNRHFGEDLRQWRWENVAPDRRFLPVWSADTLLAGPVQGPAETRYAPLELPNRGHPTALSWGPSPVYDERAAPAAWEGWIRTDAWEQYYVRRRYFNLEAFLGRYRAPNRIPLPIVLETHAEPLRRTTLVPVETANAP